MWGGEAAIGGVCHGKRGSSGIAIHPPRFSTSMKSGVVGRDGCSVAVGPHSRRSHVQMWRRSRVSRSGCTHAQQSGQRVMVTEYSHGDRPQMAIAGVHHTCHFMSGQMYEEEHYTTFPTPSSQVRIEAENA